MSDAPKVYIEYREGSIERIAPGGVVVQPPTYSATLKPGYISVFSDQWIEWAASTLVDEGDFLTVEINLSEIVNDLVRYDRDEPSALREWSNLLRESANLIDSALEKNGGTNGGTDDP